MMIWHPPLMVSGSAVSAWKCLRRALVPDEV